MKTKAKSVQVFELRLWSKKHFIAKGDIQKPKGAYENNIYDGFVVDAKSKKGVWFKSPAKMLSAIERLYKDAERREQK
jgi:hypothetical protein